MRLDREIGGCDNCADGGQQRDQRGDAIERARAVVEFGQPVFSVEQLAEYDAADPGPVQHHVNQHPQGQHARQAEWSRLQAL